jgi:acyl-CoA hydrolase
MKSKFPKDSYVEMTEIVLPQHTNSLGTIFGGTVLAWVDIAAAICAMRHANLQVVTASLDAMHFLAPIRLGWVVNIKASMNFTAKSSCEVGVKVIAESPLTGERSHTASAYLTLVSVNKEGKPVPMPSLVPETPKEIQRFEDARKRRGIRLELKAKQASRIKSV